MSSPTTAGVAALVVHAYIDEAEKQGLEQTRPDPDVVFEALESGAVFDEAKGHTEFNIGKGFVQAQASVDAARAAARSDAGGETDASAPTVDTFDARDTNTNDQNATIEADYAVVDGDGDLDSLTIELSGTDGASQSRSPAVSGDAASGTVSFDRITQAGGETYTLTLTVTDAAGATTTDSETIEVEQRGQGGGNKRGNQSTGHSFAAQ